MTHRNGSPVSVAFSKGKHEAIAIDLAPRAVSRTQQRADFSPMLHYSEFLSHKHARKSFV